MGLDYHVVGACILMGYSTISLGDWCLMFQYNIVLSPSMVERSKKNEAVTVDPVGGLR